ncbi:MAG: Pr6Pr family membrane protein, partial [Nocardioides sp.]|uniref:Pr6Pr family membrane protein n=1 Tax=Nocardioides sp. TaxID=35761 RepID=UPI003D6C34DC
FRGALSRTPAEGSDLATVVVNFFSYFTIDSNLVAVAALVAGGAWALTRGGEEPAWITVLLAAAATFMIITGLVYNLLLRGLVPSAVPWANEILHLIGPAFLLLDLFLAPPRRPLPWRAVGAVIAFPILWAAYTLIRGEHVVSPLTGDLWWYPYPFLDNHLHGYGVVLAYVVGIAAAFTLVAWGVVAVGRRRSLEAAGQGR